MDVIKELCELKDTIAQEIAEANQRIRQSGGDMNTADIDIIDKLAHSMKSLATTVAMLKAEDDGYSGRYYAPTYTDRDRVTGNSGRNENRYSRNDRGYSRTGEMMEHLRQMLDMAPDENTRMEIKRLMENIDKR